MKVFGANWRLPIALAVAVLSLSAQRVDASTITLNGSGTMSYSYQFLWSNPSTPTVSNDYDLAVQGQYAFLDQFLSQQPNSPNLASSSIGPYDFQDSYRFTISGTAAGDTMVASLGAGNTFNISNLQFRLYMVPTSTTAPIVGGIPTGSKLITAWQGPASGSNQVTAEFSDIQAGTYILDVAGIANGSSGGTYVGQVNLVPLPAPLLLLLSGIGGLAGFARRRAAAAA